MLIMVDYGHCRGILENNDRLQSYLQVAVEMKYGVFRMICIDSLIRSVPSNAALQVIFGILIITTPIQGQVLSGQDDQTILTRLSLSRYDVQELVIPDSPVSSFTISLNLDGDIVELELAPHSVRSDGFRVRTRDADGKTSS